MSLTSRLRTVLPPLASILLIACGGIPDGRDMSLAEEKELAEETIAGSLETAFADPVPATAGSDLGAMMMAEWSLLPDAAFGEAVWGANRARLEEIGEILFASMTETELTDIEFLRMTQAELLGVALAYGEDETEVPDDFDEGQAEYWAAGLTVTRESLPWELVEIAGIEVTIGRRNPDYKPVWARIEVRVASKEDGEPLPIDRLIVDQLLLTPNGWRTFGFEWVMPGFVPGMALPEPDGADEQD